MDIDEKSKSSDRLRGVAFIILSAFFFALMSTFLRLSGDLPTTQKAFFRNFVALILAVAMLKKKDIPFKPHDKKNIPALLIRSSCGLIGILGNFYAVDHLVLSDASMLNKMSPFFAVLFSFLFLKEKLTLFQGLTIAAAFTGSLFVIKPTAGVLSSLPALAGFAGGVGAGAAYAAVRYAGSHGEKGPFIVAFFSAFSTLFFLPFLIFDYHQMTAAQLIFLLLAGLWAACGQFSITAAYTCAPAKEISVYDYTQLIFATLIGFIIFGDVPDVYSFIGYAIIVGAAVASFLHVRKKA
ncbi:MAG: DMT family transporter [Ruminococcus sp.]|nr:DMT family transporter [Ruminococcus sp.]